MPSFANTRKSSIPTFGPVVCCCFDSALLVVAVEVLPAELVELIFVEAYSIFFFASALVTLDTDLAF